MLPNRTTGNTVGQQRQAVDVYHPLGCTCDGLVTATDVEEKTKRLQIGTNLSTLDHDAYEQLYVSTRRNVSRVRLSGCFMSACCVSSLAPDKEHQRRIYSDRHLPRPIHTQHSQARTYSRRPQRCPGPAPPRCMSSCAKQETTTPTAADDRDPRELQYDCGRAPGDRAGLDS